MSKLNKKLINYPFYKVLLDLGVKESDAYKIAEESAKNKLHLSAINNSLKGLLNHIDGSNQKLRDHVDLSNQELYEHVQASSVKMQQDINNKQVDVLKAANKANNFITLFLLACLTVIGSVISILLFILNS